MAFEIKRLSEVCRLINGRAYKKHEMLAEGKYPLLRVGNFFTNRGWFYSDLELDEDKYCDEGDLLYAWSASFGPRVWDGSKVIYHYHIWKIELNSELVDKRYLYHLLDWDTEQIKAEQGTGSTMIHVTKGSMENRLLPFPPIPEQKRIVAILDQAFAEIDQARANAQQNLNNARELFESYLQQIFSQRGEGWVEKNIDEVLTLEYGKPLDKSLRKDDGIYPAYGANGVKAWSDEYYYDKKTIIVGRKGSAGELTMTEDKFWPLDVTYFVSFDEEKYDLLFIYYMLTRLDLPSLATGVKPGINRNVVYAILVSVPSLNMQEAIRLELEALSKKVSNLESIYLAKLKSLDQLKKSILQKAFTGELTKESKGVAA